MPRFQDIPQFKSSRYEADASWAYIGDWMIQNNVDMDPDFQRGHVWTDQQRTAYVEFRLRGGQSGRDIYWNCADWGTGFSEPTVIVDGKQRITAVLKFLNDEIPVFGHTFGEYEDKLSMFSLSTTFRFHVNDLKTRADVIEWYLELNYAGTPHTEEELERVRKLLNAPPDQQPKGG